MPKAITRPTVDEVLELYQVTKRRYEESGLYAQFDEADTFYELDFKERLGLDLDVLKDAVVLPTGRDLLDACVDHTNISNVRVSVNQKGDSHKEMERAMMMRKFGLGVLYRNDVEASVAPTHVGRKYFWQYGLAVFQTVWDADRYFDKPERKEDESEKGYAERIDEWRATAYDSIPIVILPKHPRTVMLDPFYDGGMFVFETREKLCLDVKMKFPGWTNPEGRKISDRVEHISFWTKDYRCELYDKEPVLKVKGGVAKHNYGFIPYVAIDSGLGIITPDNDLKKRYVGILHYIRDLLISESRDYSIADIILKYQAWPWGYLKGPGAASVTEIFSKYGEYTALPDGVELVEMAPKVPPDALIKWLSISADYLSAHAAPRSVRGLSEAGVRSYVDRSQLISQAAIRYQYSNEALKHGMAKVLSNCARIMKNVVPGDLRVWARTPRDEFDVEIKKEDMIEPFTFFVDFSPVSEEDEYRRHDDLLRLTNSGKGGLVTVEWARRQMSNVDPLEMEVQEEIEKLKNNPALQQIIATMAVNKMQEAIRKRMGAEALMAAPEQQVAGQGMPPQGQEAGILPRSPVVSPYNIPKPGSVEELRKRISTTQSKTPINAMQGFGGGGS